MAFFLGMTESIWSDGLPFQDKPEMKPTTSRQLAPSQAKNASGGPRSFSSSADEFRPSYSLIGLLASIARLRFTWHFRE
jgi:hypothetical protein